MSTDTTESRINKKMEDALLAEKSRLWQKLFTDRLPDFEGFDPGLNAAFAANWLATIEAFERHPTDENTQDQLQDYTQTMYEAANRALDKLRDLVYFVQRAFPGSKRKLDEFATDQIPRLRQKNFTDMVAQCYVTHRVLLQYQTELEAAGMPPTLPAQWLQTTNQLNEAMLQQKHYMRTRIQLTGQRIALYNTLYHNHRTVAEAARIVYAQRPDIARQYTAE